MDEFKARLLRSIEWNEPSGGNTCPDCGGTKPIHSQECALASWLEEIEEEAKEAARAERWAAKTPDEQNAALSRIMHHLVPRRGRTEGT